MNNVWMCYERDIGTGTHRWFLWQLCIFEIVLVLGKIRWVNATEKISMRKMLLQVTNNLRFSCPYVEQIWLKRKQKKVHVNVKKGRIFDIQMNCTSCVHFEKKIFRRDNDWIWVYIKRIYKGIVGGNGKKANDLTTFMFNILVVKFIIFKFIFNLIKRMERKCHE